MFCVFREFCGSKYLCKSVKSVGEYSLPVCSVNSVNSVGVLFWLRGYGRDAIPTQPLTSRGCSCLSCTNKADGIHLPDWCTSCSGKRQSRAETRHQRSKKCTSCSVGALETSAPPENSIRLIRC